MRRVRRTENFSRVMEMVNSCNTQMTNLNDLSIIRATLSHVANGPGIEPIGSLEQLADEACISQASVSRFVRRMGYSSYADFRESFVREFDELARKRAMDHDAFRRSIGSEALPDALRRTADRNVAATMECMDWDSLARVISRLVKARSVLILGDDHVLSDLFTVQLDLLACGVPAYLHKNVGAQASHARMLGAEDAVLFASVAVDFVREPYRETLGLARNQGAYMAGLCQDDDVVLSELFDDFLLFGEAGSGNRGFSSLWLLSEVISEMIYEA